MKKKIYPKSRILATSQVRSKLYSFLDDMITSAVEDSLANVVSVNIPEYDASWCPADYVASRKEEVALEKAKKAYVNAIIDSLLVAAPEAIKSATQIQGSSSEWTYLSSKSVPDSDGFYTDYTLYTNLDRSKFICMFGDNDWYEPDEDYADFETESEDEAWEWFNSYAGITDDDEDSEWMNDIMSSTSTRPDADYIVRNMYQSFPEVEFLDERDMGDDVALYFRYTKDLTGDREAELHNYLSSCGANFRVKDGMLRIIAHDSYNDIEAADDMHTSNYWYFTTHGVMPGSVPKGINILDIKDTPNGSFFLTDSIIKTDDLKYYDIKERKPQDVKGSSFGSDLPKDWYFTSSGLGDFVLTTKTWPEMIKALKAKGLSVDAAYHRRPEEYISLIQNEESPESRKYWIARVTQYFNGDYEIRSDNIFRDSYYDE